MNPKKKVIVVGGGISGLAAAHRLCELSRQTGEPLEITLLEASPRLGGVIETRSQGGFLLEGGPDSFISEKPAALELSRRLSISQEVIGTNEKFRRSFVYKNGKLIPVPEGFYLIAPTHIPAFLASRLLDWKTKCRMGYELFIPRGKTLEDESVGSFVRRRFGEKTLQEIAQPMIGGIYTADPELLSLEATFPQFLELERHYGSVIKGLLARKANRNKSAVQVASGRPGKPGEPRPAIGAGPRYSLFLSYKAGMETLVKALSARMPEVQLKLASPVARIQYAQKWNVALQSGTFLEADAVCVALPAHQTARILAVTAPWLASSLASIPYESVATVNLAYQRTDIPHSLRGFGFVVPAISGKKIVACSFSSIKFAGRAPEGRVLLRAFVGGALHREVYALEDQAMERTVREELQHYLGIKRTPLFSRVMRYPHTMPQYQVGHLNLVKAIQLKLAAFPGLYLAGNAYQGIGVPDCVKGAELAAESMHRFLKQKNPSVQAAGTKK